MTFFPLKISVRSSSLPLFWWSACDSVRPPPDRRIRIGELSSDEGPSRQPSSPWLLSSKTKENGKNIILFVLVRFKLKSNVTAYLSHITFFNCEVIYFLSTFPFKMVMSWKVLLIWDKFEWKARKEVKSSVILFQNKWKSIFISIF